MGEYRTPGREGWGLWSAVALTLLLAGGALGFWPGQPLASLIGWELVLAACAGYALWRAGSSWRSAPIVIRLSQNHVTARRGDGSLMAEIPYSAIKTIREPFWSNTVIIVGADGLSRIEIPLSTKGIRELLTALAELIPAYLWNLDQSRRFSVPVHWGLMALTAVFMALMLFYFMVTAWPWPAVICGVLVVAGLTANLLLARAYQISHSGITIRRAIGARFIPAAEIAAVQLKRGHAQGLPLYVNLLLNSGKQVGLLKADQSAVVLYRAVLAMHKVRT